METAVNREDVPRTDWSGPEAASRSLPESGTAQDRENQFAALAGEFYERIFHFIIHQIRDREDAEDLTQRAFVRAWRAFHRFDPERPFAPWIFTIARREIADFFRRRKPGSVELMDEHASTAHSPRGEAIQGDDAGRVWNLAESLPQKQRQVLVLHYAEGFSLAETAGIMGLTHVHAKVLAFRARKRLRLLWNESKGDNR